MPEVQAASFLFVSFELVLDVQAAPTPHAAAADKSQCCATDVMLYTQQFLVNWSDRCSISRLRYFKFIGETVFSLHGHVFILSTYDSLTKLTNTVELAVQTP